MIPTDEINVAGRMDGTEESVGVEVEWMQLDAKEWEDGRDVKLMIDERRPHERRVWEPICLRWFTPRIFTSYTHTISFAIHLLYRCQSSIFALLQPTP